MNDTMVDWLLNVSCPNHGQSRYPYYGLVCTACHRILIPTQDGAPLYGSVSHLNVGHPNVYNGTNPSEGARLCDANLLPGYSSGSAGSFHSSMPSLYRPVYDHPAPDQRPTRQSMTQSLGTSSHQQLWVSGCDPTIFRSRC